MPTRAAWLLALALSTVTAHARDIDKPLVDRKAGQPALLVFDVAPGYMRDVLMPIADEEEDTTTLRIRIDPPQGVDWSKGHWNPTAFLCLTPTAKSKATSYCANVTQDASLKSFGTARLVMESGGQMFRKLTSRQFAPDDEIELRIVRKGRVVTTTIGGEVIDEGELPFVPTFMSIGASTGIAHIEVLEEAAETLGPGRWPTTLEAAVADALALLSKDDIASLRAMPRTDMANFRVGWGTALIDRQGLALGNHALLESACGKGCDDANAAALAIMEGVWDALHAAQPAP